MFVHTPEMKAAIRLNRREDRRQEFLAPAESAEIQVIEDAERERYEAEESLRRR